MGSWYCKINTMSLQACAGIVGHDRLLPHSFPLYSACDELMSAMKLDFFAEYRCYQRIIKNSETPCNIS
jgi:hypothetical protein